MSEVELGSTIPVDDDPFADMLEEQEKFQQPEGGAETAEQIAAREAAEAAKAGEGDGGEGGKGSGEEGAAAGEYKPSPIWDQFKERFGEEFEIPEAVTKGEFAKDKTELDYISEAILANSEIDTDALNPLAKDLIAETANPEFDEAKWIEEKYKEQAVLNLNDEDLVTRFYKSRYGKSEKRPDGRTDEQIASDIAKQKESGILAKEAMTIREGYKQFTENQRVKKQEAVIEAHKESMNNFIEARNKSIDVILEGVSKQTNFMGIEFSESEVQEMMPQVEKMLKMDPETGTFPFYDYLNNDQNIVSLVMLALKGDKGIKNFIDGKLESLKDEIKNKTGAQPLGKEGGMLGSSAAEADDLI